MLLTMNCSDSFVDIPPQYSIDSENYFNIQEDYEQAVIAAYDLLQTTYLNSMLEKSLQTTPFAVVKALQTSPVFSKSMI